MVQSSVDNESDAGPRRTFAVDVVCKLREAGFQALWAGGCVRDALLGLTPKDYDVATDARPEQVIQLFGKRRTVAVGASFGVVMVLGKTRDCGQIEVATFRTDGEYSDGRRPVTVTYCSASEDAKRRDFTINGMFIDPLTREVIDYVGGQEDLKKRCLRAIGDAHRRFAEDKLRMLRAVRFAATYDLQIEKDTFSAISHHRLQLVQVSAERIAAELRRMLAHRTRSLSVSLLHDTGLLSIIFPECYGEAAQPEKPALESLRSILKMLAVLETQHFEPALAILLAGLHRPDGDSLMNRTSAIREQCHRLRLSRKETDAVCWLVDSHLAAANPQDSPLHVVKLLLADERRTELIAVLRATQQIQDGHSHDADWLERYLAEHSEDQINPAPLINGADLKARDVAAGPQFSTLLNQIRQQQLDEWIVTREQALQRLDELLASS
jgi:poly(A) polymerase